MNTGSWLNRIPASHQLRALALARGPRIATWALALGLGVQAATIVTDLAGGGQSGKTANARPPSPASVAHHGIDIASITNSHLFGTAADAARGVNAADAPQTSMSLVLTGIIAGKNPSAGFAILGENATAAKVHAVGDNVPGGAKLHSVYSDRVLLDRNGRLESLSLPHQAGGFGASTVQAAVPTQNPSFERVRRLISEDPTLLSDIMRNQPVLMAGKLHGFRVYPGRNRQAFVRLGLRPGDLVVAINGTPLDDPARGDEIFRTIGSASEARVTVMRNGQQQDLTLNMSQVAQEAEQAVGPEATPPPPEPEKPVQPAPEPEGTD